MSSAQQQRKVVEQLRREAAMRRLPASHAIEDLKVGPICCLKDQLTEFAFWQKYIQERESDDCLLVGFHSQKANPFREKSSCLIL